MGSANHLLGRAIGLSFRLVPRRFRFRAAVCAARLLQPYIRRTQMYELRIQQRADTIREITLDIVMRTLTRYGTTYDPIATVEGIEHLPPTDQPGPMLVVSPHMMLGMVFFRLLRERGWESVLLATGGEMRVPGTREPLRVEPAPSPELLLRVRRHFQEGRVVVAAIDRADPEPHNALYQTRRGEMRFSHALVRLAAHCGARVLFMGTWLDERSRIVLRLAPAGAADADGMLAEFVAFVDAMPVPAPASLP